MADELIQQSVLNKARKDKFLLVLDIPPVLKKINSNVRSNSLINLDKLQFSVYGTVVPPISIEKESLNVYGQAYNVTTMTRPAYAPVSVRFNVDNNFDNYWVLWKWLAILNDPRKSGMDKHFAEFTTVRDTPIDTIRDIVQNTTKNPPHNLKYKHIQMKNDYTDYQTTITIFGLREYNEKIVRFDYYNSFITNLGEINYDYKDVAEMESRFDFAFNQLDVTLLENNTDVKV